MDAVRRVVVGARNVETLQPVAEGEQPFVLLPEGGYERLPAHIDAFDDAAIRRHYSAEEVVRAKDVGFCRGVLLDGPGAGEEHYAVRRLGYRITIGPTTYEVVDAEPEVVRLREV